MLGFWQLFFFYWKRWMNRCLHRICTQQKIIIKKQTMKMLFKTLHRAWMRKIKTPSRNVCCMCPCLYPLRYIEKYFLFWLITLRKFVAKILCCFFLSLHKRFAPSNTFFLFRKFNFTSSSSSFKRRYTSI